MRVTPSRSSSDTCLISYSPTASRRRCVDNLTQPFDLVFKEGFEGGVIDRAVEIVFREVGGPAEGFGESGCRRIRGTGRRGLPRRIRPRHHR